MQFIERSSFSLRSAIYYLERKEGGPRFILFPMIHVGDKDFYADVARRLAECDSVVAEGVSSKRAALLTSSYRIVKYVRRLDLITQHEMDTSTFRTKIVNAEMKQKEFDELYSALPLLDRIQIFLLFPLFAVYLLLFGTRQFIASELAIEDLPTSEELLADDMFERLEDVILIKRDSVLIQRLQSLVEDPEADQKQIGILYGAKHMRSIVMFLMGKLGYSVSRAEWVTVFDL